MRFVAILWLCAVGACANAHDIPVDAMTDSFVTDGCTPQPEKCDGIDNDCDLNIDEDWDERHHDCTLGMGACMASGKLECNEAGDGLACNATIGTPGVESCDGTDEDCDGKTDEDFHVAEPCDGPDSDQCKEGTMMCVSATAAACTDTSSDSIEMCNGVDDDCDAAFDEGFGVGTACDGADSDACNEGILACNGSGGTVCMDPTGDSVEKCNGIDDDCRNGIDDTFPVNQACTVGVGACASTGTYVCNAAQSGVRCTATAGTAQREYCGDGIDSDCNGADPTCASNDLPAGAIDISSGGTFTADLTYAHDDNWSATPSAEFDCGDMGGRDVFYTFTLPAEEVVYYDSFGSSFDSIIRIFAGSCTSIGAVKACVDDECGLTQSQGAIDLPAGQYCLVLDQFKDTATTGVAVLNFKRGGHAGTVLIGPTGTKTGSTVMGGTDEFPSTSCEPNTARPDVAFAMLSCPAARTFKVNTCNTATSYDTVLSMKTGTVTSANVACDDDGCGSMSHSTITKSITGANLQWFILDGFGASTTTTGGFGTYSLSYSVQ